MLKFIFQLNNLFSRQKFKNHVADVSVFLLARLILRRNDDSGQQLLLKDETSDRVSPAAAVSILCCCFAVLCIATIQSNPVTLNFYTKQDVRYWGRWSFNSSVLFKDLAWISIIKKKKKMEEQRYQRKDRLGRSLRVIQWRNAERPMTEAMVIHCFQRLSTKEQSSTGILKITYHYNSQYTSVRRSKTTQARTWPELWIVTVASSSGAAPTVIVNFEGPRVSNDATNDCERLQAVALGH